MANEAGDEHKAFSKTEMHAESCRYASNCLGESHAGKSKRKRSQRRLKEKQHKITAAIPADVVGDLLKLMNPKEAIRIGSVCRYWLAPALACDPILGPTPWKIALTQSEYHLHFRLQYAADPSVFIKIRPVSVFPRAVTCLGSWHGWLVLRRSLPSAEISLLNPFSHVRLFLPPCNGLYDVLCVTSDPAAPDCAVIARDYESNLLIWRPGNGSWATEAVEGGLDLSCTAVWFKEQLIVLDLCNTRLLSLKLNPQCCNDLKVKFCVDMLDPSGRFRRDTTQHLVKYQGDLLAFDVGCRLNYYEDKWNNIRVFRMDWTAMAFVQAETKAEWTVFAGGGGEAISLSAQEAGSAAGCLYYADSFDCADSWSRFSWHCCNFKDQTITHIRNGHMSRFPKSRGQFWIIPPKKK